MATFGIGFVMRPLGGFVIGNYADRHGRKAAMTLTIGLMVARHAVPCRSPRPMLLAGLFGPLMIVAGRLLQGFSLGGEIGASTAMLMESGSVKGRGFRVSWQLGSQGIAATLGALTAAILYGSAAAGVAGELGLARALRAGPADRAGGAVYPRAPGRDAHGPAACPKPAWHAVPRAWRHRWSRAS
ncbi:MFS transporter [Cupriavidus basilensis]